MEDRQGAPDESEGQLAKLCYLGHASDWKLSVPDNGVGMPPQTPGRGKQGIGTSSVKALADQIEIATGPKGTTVSLTHATFEPRLPTVA